MTSWWRALYDQPYVLLTLTVTFWSGNFVLGRAVAGEVPPIGLAFWRWLGGLVIVLAFAWPQVRKDWPTIRRHWPILLLLSAIGIAAFNTFVYIGLNTTTAINAGLLQSTMPVMIILFSFAFFRDGISPKQAVGVAISLAGVIIILARGDLGVLTSLSFVRGDLWVVLAVICYAGYSAFLRLKPALHAMSFLAVLFAGGVILLLPLYAWETASGAPMQVNLLTAGAVLYVAIFPAILAYICFNRGVELIGANRAGVFIHLMPAMIAVLAIILLGEQLRLFHGVGIVLILAGITLAARARAGKLSG